MKMKIEKEKGAAGIILTVLILAVILVISLGLANLMLAQIRMSIQVDHSNLAYFAAESGIERGLREVWEDQSGSIYNGGAGATVSRTLSNNAVYEVTWAGGASKTIISSGVFQKTHRQIEVSW